MTPTDKARRSDSLYYDTDAVNRRNLCDMIANRESDLEDARAENAKLRELCADMEECLEHSKPLCKGCKFQELNCQWFKFDDRMRELGVEVDG